MEPATASVDSDGAPSRAPSACRGRIAFVAIVLGVAATMLPAGVGGGAYLRRVREESPFGISIPMGPEHWYIARESGDLFDYVGRDAAWTMAVASLVGLALGYGYWRGSAMSGARAIGIVWSAATAAGTFCLAQFVAASPVIWIAEGLFWMHVAAALCFAAAFAIAPPPRNVEALGVMQNRNRTRQPR